MHNGLTHVIPQLVEMSAFGLVRNPEIEKRLIQQYDYFIFCKFYELKNDCFCAAQTGDAVDILVANQSIENFKVTHSDWNYLRVLFGLAKVGKEPEDWKEKQ